MKKILYAFLVALALFPSTTFAAALNVNQGGTGSTTLFGLLKGNGTGAIQTAIPGVDYLISAAGGGAATSSFTATYPIKVTPSSSAINFSLLDMTTTTASCSGTVSCSSFTIVGSSPITITGSGGSGTVTSIIAGTGLTGGTITTSGTIALDFTHVNTWTGLQNFRNASTSEFTATSSVFFTGIAASSILATDANGMVIATSSIGANNITGVLPIAHGGTGASALSDTGIPYVSGGKLTTANIALFFDGTSLNAVAPIFTGNISGVSETLSSTLGVTGKTTLGNASTTLLTNSGAMWVGGNITDTGTQILQQSSGSSGIELSRAAVSNSAGVIFDTNLVNQWTYGLRGDNTNNFYIRDNINGVSAMTILQGTSDKIGINATSSPFALLSVAGAAGAAVPLFTIASSTSGFATTTAFLVDANGNTTIGNNGSVLNINGATTTAANGINLTTGCFSVAGTCITSGGGGGTAWAWTQLNNFGTTTNATTTAYTAPAYFASSSLASVFPYASSTALTVTQNIYTHVISSGVELQLRSTGSSVQLYDNSNNEIVWGIGQLFTTDAAATIGSISSPWAGIYLGNASTTQLTATGNTWFSGITAGSLLATDANQQLVATSSIGLNLLSTSGATPGQVIADVGGIAKWVSTSTSGGSGTVTSIIAGTGLTGGTITTSGTIALDQSFGAIWTAASSTNSGHFSLNTASSTQFSSPTIWDSTVGNALWLGDANGKATAYSGTNPCSANQAIVSLSALGVGTCSSTFLTSAITALGNYATTTGSSISISTTTVTVNGLTYGNIFAVGANGITVTPTVTGTYNGSAGSVANSATFNNGGSGGASGSTFNGSGALTVSYNTIGAVPTTRNVNTTFPLQGGGALSADLTLTSAFGTTTNSGLTANQFVITNGSGVLVTSASSTLDLPNSALQNSSITVNGTAFNLGDNKTISAASSSLLTDSNTFAGHNIFTASTTMQAQLNLLGASSTLFSATNVWDSALSSGNCVQAGAGGLLTTTGSACGSGGGISGTTGQVAYFSGTNTAVGTSTIFVNNASAVFIGTTTPTWSGSGTPLFLEGSSTVDLALGLDNDACASLANENVSFRQQDIATGELLFSGACSTGIFGGAGASEFINFNNAPISFFLNGSAPPKFEIAPGATYNQATTMFLGTSTPGTSAELYVSATTSQSGNNLVLTVASTTGVSLFSVNGAGAITLPGITAGSLLATNASQQLAATSSIGLNLISTSGATAGQVIGDVGGIATWISTSTSAGGTNYFTNTSATTTLNTGSMLVAGAFTATTTNGTATSTFPRLYVGNNSNSNTNVIADFIGQRVQMGPVQYPANYVTACATCAYLIMDKAATADDTSVVFRDQGNARGEIGLVGDNSLHFKTATGSFGSESFSDVMTLTPAKNVGIGTTTPTSLLSVGTNSNFTVDYSGNASTTGTFDINGAFQGIGDTGLLNGVLSITGHEASGQGAYERIRDDTLGTIGYFGQNSVINGGTAYAQFDVQNPQSTGTLCFSAGGRSSATAGASCDILDTSAGLIGLSTTTPWTALDLGPNAAISTTEASSTGAATVVINWLNGNQQKVAMNQNTIIDMNHNSIPGQTMRLILCQDGTGSRTLTWNLSSSSLQWPSDTTPTVTATANHCDIFSFLVTQPTTTVQTFGAVTQNYQ